MPDSFENTPAEAEMYAQVALKASREAVARTWAAGLPITILKDGKIVDVYPDGHEVVIEEANLQ